MKTKVVDINTVTHEQFAAGLWWKASQCPSCHTVNGWRIGAKWCLNCVEWRSVKPRYKKYPRKLVGSK